MRGITEKAPKLAGISCFTLATAFVLEATGGALVEPMTSGTRTVLVVTDGELVVMETALVTVVIALVVTAGTATPSAHSPTVVANIRRNTLNAPPFIGVKLVGNRSFCERFL